MAQGRDFLEHQARPRHSLVDCDGDTLLVQVEPVGPARHTGTVSCFLRRLDAPRSE